jgi:hypothetical protein
MGMRTLAWREVLVHQHHWLLWRYADWFIVMPRAMNADWLQGVNGLTKRDIQLILDGGLYTVESVAYT